MPWGNLKGFAVQSGLAAVRVTIPLPGYTIITFQAQTGGTRYTLLDLGNVEAVNVAPTPADGAALKLDASSATSGGGQTIFVTTAPNSSFILAITYPNGTQLVVGPKLADATGTFTYAWSLPSGVTGTVHVALIEASGKITQATFTIRR